MRLFQHSTTPHSFTLAVLRVVSAGSVLALVACGGAQANEPAEGAQETGFPEAMLPDEVVADLPLVAPKTDLEIPVFSGVVDVAPGEDVTFCTFSEVILEDATIFGESFGAQSPQGHHAILQYTTTPETPGTRSCDSENMGSTILLGGTGGKSVKDTADLPLNYGVEVPAGAQLVMNHHWINTSDEAVRGQSMMLARRLERGGDTVLAGNMIMLGIGWEIPAQSEHTFETECTFQEEVSYVTSLGHMHEWGSHVSIDVTRAAGGVESIIDRRWSADDATGASGRELYSLDQPMKILKGDTVKLSCTWNNDTTEALGFPREMCIFFGNTVGQNFFCANGIWLDAAAAEAAGAQDVINSL